MLFSLSIVIITRFLLYAERDTQQLYHIFLLIQYVFAICLNTPDTVHYYLCWTSY